MKPFDSYEAFRAVALRALDDNCDPGGNLRYLEYLDDSCPEWMTRLEAELEAGIPRGWGWVEA
jgi:hypothetical protein